MDFPEGEQAADTVFENLVDRVVALFRAEEALELVVFREERLDEGCGVPLGLPVAPAVIDVEGL